MAKIIMTRTMIMVKMNVGITKDKYCEFKMFDKNLFSEMGPNNTRTSIMPEK